MQILGFPYRLKLLIEKLRTPKKVRLLRLLVVTEELGSSSSCANLNPVDIGVGLGRACVWRNYSLTYIYI